MNSDCSNEVFAAATEEYIKNKKAELCRVRAQLQMYLHPSTLSDIMDQPLPPYLVAKLLPPVPDVEDIAYDDDVDDDWRRMREKLKQLQLQLNQLQEESKQILKVVHHLKLWHFTDILSGVIRPYLDRTSTLLATYRAKLGINAHDQRMRIDQQLREMHLDAPDGGLAQQQQQLPIDQLLMHLDAPDGGLAQQQQQQN